MECLVLRFSSQHDDTLGLLFIDDAFQCFTLEDEKRSAKIFGETRIPEGRYKITLRDTGGFHNRYLSRYGRQFHKGMLWVRDVPGFEYILIHVGNDDDDTAGCLLVGQTAQTNKGKDGFIGASRPAYKNMYPKVRDHILAGGEVWITYKAIA